MISLGVQETMGSPGPHCNSVLIHSKYRVSWIECSDSDPPSVKKRGLLRCSQLTILTIVQEWFLEWHNHCVLKTISWQGSWEEPLPTFLRPTTQLCRYYFYSACHRVGFTASLKGLRPDHDCSFEASVGRSRLSGLLQLSSFRTYWSQNCTHGLSNLEMRSLVLIHWPVSFPAYTFCLPNKEFVSSYTTFGACKL